jgi:hypothetical protein
MLSLFWVFVEAVVLLEVVLLEVVLSLLIKVS